jgi:DNA polymerase IV
MSSQRIIAHFDLDAFFVNVELLRHPELRGKPIIVGGYSDRGVVSAASYEARKFGIHSAMPMIKAKQLCPQAIILNGGRSDYGKYSRYVTEIIAAKAPLFEKASVDEFYLDLTGMDKYYDVLEWTKALRQEIMDKTLLPISFGLAANKMVAKIATDEAKPNGYLFVQFGKEKEFLSTLKVNKFPGVGESTHQVLQRMGITYIGDICKLTEQQMEEALGKHGTDLWHKAHGKHSRAVTPYHEAKSISSENTFNEDSTDTVFLLQEIVRLTEKIGHELREEGKMSTCVAVKIRYKGFDTFSKQTTAKELFTQLYTKDRPVRLLGVRLSNFIIPYQQTDLFNNKEKFNNLYKAIDNVKDRFGKKLLNRGSTR